MSDDELEEYRTAAIREERCFSKGRLRDEFRMKPAPDSEPVAWYKNAWGGRFAVYRINDCVPMRPKKTVTEKQLRAGEKLALRSRLKSKSARISKRAGDLLASSPVFLDTETTGLGNRAEAIEIGVTDAMGHVLMNERIRPTVSVDVEAEAVHGISDRSLSHAPGWPDVAERLRDLLTGRPVIIFNADFDMRILQQTALAHDDTAAWLTGLDVHCAMAIAAAYYGATNRYGTISLANAVLAADVSWSGAAHSASGDASTTAAVIHAIAQYYQNLSRQCVPDPAPKD
ncbi:3'-5' exonuclease [Erwinia mallotivora]|uniref:3'-5' exonuclease n=1 Tax=Erwinia mallotivora TaxID=69222 RepID=UPI0021BE58B9|nr:3'-5' exonuclease [Erwinia mallotivora]